MTKSSSFHVPLAVVLKRSDDEVWLFVIGGHTCPEAGVGRLDVSVAVVDSNDYGGVLCGVAVGIVGIGKHISLFLPLRRRCRF